MSSAHLAVNANANVRLNTNSMANMRKTSSKRIFTTGKSDLDKKYHKNTVRLALSGGPSRCVPKCSNIHISPTVPAFSAVSRKSRFASQINAVLTADATADVTKVRNRPVQRGGVDLAQLFLKYHNKMYGCLLLCRWRLWETDCWLK